MKRQLLILVIMMTTAILSAQVIHVPGDQPTIQAGIDVAMNGDTVLVAENTYYENVRFKGKAITLSSEFIIDGDTNHINNTIIDGSQPAYPDSAACVMFVHGEDTTSILSGFTLTGGSGVWTIGFNIRSGGGVYAYEAGGKIMYNKIMYNQVESDSGGGAGLQFLGGDNYWAIIDNNTISHNTSISDGYSAFGSGMSILVNAVIKNNIIENNTSINTNQMADGGGIELELWEANSDQYAYVHNNIIRNNTVDGATNAMGAGIMSFYVPCEITNNSIYNNTANAGNRCLGGGLRILFPDLKVIVENNEIYGNTLVGDYGQGGGIDIGGAADLVILSNNDVFNNEINSTTASWGAGINFVQNEDLLITNNYIYHNTIAGGSWWCGAGIYNEDTYGTMEVLNNMITDNTGIGTSYGGGLGIYDTEGGTYIVSSNLIKGNHCNYGGGIWTFNTYDIGVTNNIFSSNKAWMWGGAYALRQATDDSPLNISIAHSIGEEVIYNSVSDTSLHPMVANNTFYNNTAGSYSGAIDSDQDEFTPVIFNNVFWKNSAPNANNIWYGGSDTLTISHCLINEADTSIDCNYTGHGNIFEDPEFEPGDSLCLIHGGPCHDAGTDELILDGIVYSAPDVDFEGTPRPQGVKWDIGADECLMEFISESNTKSPFNLVVHPNPSSGAVHLRYSISDPSTSLRTGTRHSILELYTANGIKVRTLFSEEQQAGIHELEFDLSNLPDGLYLIRLQVGGQMETAKIVILK